MARRRAEQDGAEARATQAPRIARLVPTQQRSRERFERILACAIEVMAEKGSDTFRMSDIVERTGIAFGSLYQYFPDKAAIIGTLAERTNAIGRDCVRKELQTLRTLADLHAVLGRITDSYYQFFVDEPAVRHIWHATQADRGLQKLNAEDDAFLTGLLVEALRPLAPDVPEQALAEFCQLVMVLIAAAVRHAVTLPSKEGRRVLTLFKTMLPHDVGP